MYSVANKSRVVNEGRGFEGKRRGWGNEEVKNEVTVGSQMGAAAGYMTLDDQILDA